MGEVGVIEGWEDGCTEGTLEGWEVGFGFVALVIASIAAATTVTNKKFFMFLESSV